MVLKMRGEDQLDRLCEECRSITQSAVGQEYAIYIKKKKG